MNTVQKNSLISIFFIAPLWLIFGQLPVLLIYVEGPSPLFLFGFAASTIIGGLGWILLLLFNRADKKGKRIEFDERDRLIFSKATLAGYVVLWFYLVGACVFAWLYASDQHVISVNVMPIVIVGGIAVFHLAQGLASLIQYSQIGRTEKIVKGETL